MASEIPTLQQLKIAGEAMGKANPLITRIISHEPPNGDDLSAKKKSHFTVVIDDNFTVWSLDRRVALQQGIGKALKGTGLSLQVSVDNGVRERGNVYLNIVPKEGWDWALSGATVEEGLGIKNWGKIQRLKEFAAQIAEINANGHVVYNTAF